MSMQTIKIFDTTLRDGEQSPGASMNIEEKLRIASQLEKLNVDVIEAGFPIASDGDFEAVKKIAQTIKGPEIAGLCRGEFQIFLLQLSEIPPVNLLPIRVPVARTRKRRHNESMGCQ